LLFPAQFELLIKRTRIGKALMATALNAQGARYMGIPTERMIVFSIVALGGFGSICWWSRTSEKPLASPITDIFSRPEKSFRKASERSFLKAMWCRKPFWGFRMFCQS
jgi:hypothetical protein